MFNDFILSQIKFYRKTPTNQQNYCFKSFLDLNSFLLKCSKEWVYNQIISMQQKDRQNKIQFCIFQFLLQMLSLFDFLQKYLKMIRIHTSQSFITEPARNRVLKHCRSIEHSLQALSKNFNRSSKITPKLTYKIIAIKINQMAQQKEIYEWRQNTDFPIVKIHFFRILDEKHQLNSNSEKISSLEIQLESQFTTLEEMNRLSLSQSIYLLKETLIGCQRLFYKFGSFQIDQSLIMFNSQQKCKVWVNSDLFCNQVEQKNTKKEEEFLKDVYRILKNKTIKSKASIQFFDKIQSARYFFQAIGFIDNFTQNRKIIIPQALKNIEQSKSPLLKSSLNLDLLFKNKKQSNNLEKSDKIPSFIKNIKKLNSNQDCSTPTRIPQRKMTSISQKPILDRSMTNVSRNFSSNSFLKQGQSSKKRQQQKTLNTEEQDEFLQDMNIRLIEPVQKSNENNVHACYTPPPRILTHFSLAAERFPESPLRKYNPNLNSPSSKASGNNSPNNFGNYISMNKEENPQREQSQSNFQNAEKMFLTVIKPKKTIPYIQTTSSHIKYHSSKKEANLRNIKSDQFESIDDQESRNFSSHSQFESENSNFSEKREKRQCSKDFGNRSNRSNSDLRSNKQEMLLNIPDRSINEGSLLSVPSSRRRHTEFKPKYKRSQNRITSERQKSVKSAQNQQVEQTQILRETIMSQNGWKGLSFFDHNGKQIKQSFVDGTQIPIASNGFTTKDLSKLGLMGRQVRSSLVSQSEFQLEFEGKIMREKQVRNELINLF